MSKNDIGMEKPPCYLCKEPAQTVYGRRYVCGECCIKLIKAKEKENDDFINRFRK